MSSQSWAAWLLDSYASSVSHEPSDNSERKDEPSAHPIHSPSSQPSSAISMGSSSSTASSTPYVRTGRGGAGNFHWEPAQEQSNDVEAQKPSSLAERRKAASRLERLETSDAVAKRVSSAPFVLVGRGGAGNYTQSNEIQSAKSPRSASAVYAPSATVPTVGRGGAGNVMAAIDAKGKLQHEKDEQERQQADKRREQIELQVAGMLQPPPGGYNCEYDEEKFYDFGCVRYQLRMPKTSGLWNSWSRPKYATTPPLYTANPACSTRRGEEHCHQNDRQDNLRDEMLTGSDSERNG